MECSKLRKSNKRTEPSAPTEAKTSVPRENAKLNNSLTWAISCVRAVCVLMSHMVQVVSMDEVAIMEGSYLFQSKEVRGASIHYFCSGFVVKFDEAIKIP